MKNLCILIKIWLKLVSEDQIDKNFKKWAFVLDNGLAPLT